MNIQKIKEVATEIFEIAPLPAVQKERIEFMRDICLEKDKEYVKQADELNKSISENTKLHAENSELKKHVSELNKEIVNLKKKISDFEGGGFASDMVVDSSF